MRQLIDSMLDLRSREFLAARSGWVLPSVISLAALFISSTAVAQNEFVKIDRFVPHTSSVPANQGERVGLFVREVMSHRTADAVASGEDPEQIVLFIHGGSVPSVPDYDLQYKDYSWMEYLADAGFDVFAMDQTGYGLSPRPLMDDACNMSLADQERVIPNPLSDSCESKHNQTLTSLSSDGDEIDTVVDFIRGLRNADRIHLIGWSRGGRRVGGYASKHANKVDRIVLFAPGYDPATLSAPLYEPGVPMRTQTRNELMNDRWQSAVTCENQVDPGIRNVIWQTIMAFDPVGSVWGSDEGIMRVRTANGAGWNRVAADQIGAPTLILVGKQDELLDAGRLLYQDLQGVENKILIEMECATHFAVWEETQYKFLQEASRQWLTQGELQGRQSGAFSVDRSSLTLQPRVDELARVELCEFDDVSLLDARIQEVNQQLAELSLRFTELHPDVVALKSVLESLQVSRVGQVEAAWADCIEGLQQP